MNALKKINLRVRELQKKHPGKKRVTLQRQAGKEYRDGKLKPKKRAVKKVVRKKPVKRKVHHTKKLSAAKPKRQRVYKARVVHIKPYKAKRYRRVSGKGPSLLPVLAIGGLALGAYLLLNRPSATPQYIQTGNVQRDNSASTILAYATAAGLTATAIAKLIDSLNNSSDSQVSAAAANPQATIDNFLAD